MTPVEFRAALKALGLSQSGFARALRALGDPRPQLTILRAVQELARLDRTAEVPATMVVLLELMRRAQEAWRPWSWRLRQRERGEGVPPGP